MGKKLEGLEEGTKAKIHIDSIYNSKKISNWKTPGHDDISGSWFKKFNFLHNRLAIAINRCLQEADVPEWVTKGKTLLMQKRHPLTNHAKQLQSQNEPNKMWKILTAQVKEEIYDSLTICGLFPQEKKGCR